ncbi:MAG TPA: PhzF family phenazine biosynthesis protein, partial [Jatrophihabitans sp.]|nr:PhzF family phenazine biosynthesis protein [Jatrophihabitans sp.]
TDAAAVHAVRPEPERLASLCRRLEATGAYVFAPHPDGRRDHLVARQFPVDADLVEDPATAVAAGALAAYLAQAAATPGWSAIEVDQGDAMGRPSRLRASAFAADGVVRRVQVAGRARFVTRETVRP